MANTALEQYPKHGLDILSLSALPVMPGLYLHELWRVVLLHDGFHLRSLTDDTCLYDSSVDNTLDFGVAPALPCHSLFLPDSSYLIDVWNIPFVHVPFQRGVPPAKARTTPTASSKVHTIFSGSHVRCTPVIRALSFAWKAV